MEALHLVNQRLLRELVELTEQRQRPQKEQKAQQAREGRNTIPQEEQQHLGAPKTLTEEEKIAEPGGMIPTYSPGMGAMRGCLVGTKEVMSQPLINKGRGNNLGSNGSRTSNKSSTI